MIVAVSKMKEVYSSFRNLVFLLLEILHSVQQYSI